MGEDRAENLHQSEETVSQETPTSKSGAPFCQSQETWKPVNNRAIVRTDWDSLLTTHYSRVSHCLV